MFEIRALYLVGKKNNKKKDGEIDVMHWEEALHHSDLCRVQRKAASMKRRK